MKEYIRPTIIEEDVYVSDTAIASAPAPNCYICGDNHSNNWGNPAYEPADATTVTWDCELADEKTECFPL